ncbi:MAG TPA: tripartite tricarboxylate transporter substrate binding protein [Burkholderiales bacterium]|nr:tripartite tricarboxylate transporter substrate binding protein [Burkholderiales bacterium]
MSTKGRFAVIRSALLCLVLIGLPVQFAWSQPFPTRPIRLVVGFAPGGSTDILARLVAKEMAAQFGQQVLVENKPGASAVIATDTVAKAAPDGYTLCFCTLGAMVIVPMIEKVPYNADKDLLPVTHVANQPFVVVVRSSLGVNSLKDFIARAKADAGKITFASPGTATPSHLTGELLALATGTRLTHVPYKGDAPAIQDLLGGHVDSMMLSAIGVKPLLDAGRVKALAVSSLTRLNFMPDLPTIAESGYPGFQTNNLQAIFAPAGTRPDIINKLNAAAVAALKTPEAIEKIAGQGLIIVADTPASLAKTMQEEKLRWGNVVKQLHLKNE